MFYSRKKIKIECSDGKKKNEIIVKVKVFVIRKYKS